MLVMMIVAKCRRAAKELESRLARTDPSSRSRSTTYASLANIHTAYTAGLQVIIEAPTSTRIAFQYLLSVGARAKMGRKRYANYVTCQPIEFGLFALDVVA